MLTRCMIDGQEWTAAYDCVLPQDLQDLAGPDDPLLLGRLPAVVGDTPRRHGSALSVRR